ncbi:MAG: excinuclease ABC subunit C, partial [PVC group bacterium]
MEKISPGEYREIVDGLVLFLRGRKRDLLVSLRRRMKAESGRLEYEKAARTLAGIRAVEATLEKQKVSRFGPRPRDVIALECRGSVSVFQILSIRDGEMVGGRTELFSRVFPDDREAMSSFLAQFYGGRMPLPDEIVLPFRPAHAAALEDLLSERRKGRVKLTVPERGDKKRLLELARTNARDALRRRLAAPRLEEVLELLQKHLGLRRFPKRIECFDISNLGGKEAVGSMAVFVDGEKFPAGYRRYRIRTPAGPDDYGMLFELLGRRFRRAVEEGNLPDLVVVDGGKGQLGVARQALKDLSVRHPDVVALAKEKRLTSGRVVRDRVYLPGRKNPAALRSRSPAL